jgi:tetratricopeptide (TPR) repeat protein
MRRVVWLAAWLALARSAAAAAPPPSEPEDFSEAALDSGVSIGLGMLRLGTDDEAAIPLEGNVIVRPSTVTRLIVDEATGATFGYRIDAAPLGSRAARLVVRVNILPLEPSAERDLRRLHICAGCPALRLVASSVRYPPLQIVRAGETLVIDLLERPATGEKIVDVVKFSSEPVTREELGEVRKQLRQSSRHVRRGDALTASGALDAAASEYEKAVRLNPADAEARFLLGVIRHRRGELDRAADTYRQALKMRPGWALARMNLATSCLDRGDVAQALEGYRQAHRLDAAVLGTKDPSRVRARDAGLQSYVVAKVYATEGDLGASLAWLEKALAAGFGDLERVRTDPDFAPLRQDPRFVGLVARTNRS